jgi:hypothetical protein
MAGQPAPLLCEIADIEISAEKDPALSVFIPKRMPEFSGFWDSVAAK